MAVPDQIGRYRLGPRLGSGGFAVVWSAHDESLDTDIAIKVLAENWADRMDLRERFLAEARMLRKASSVRVVQVFDIGELPDGRPYFVMDLADRGTLAARIGTGRLPLVEALRLTAEVARGAADLHRAGIVHRDLKPTNVLIKSTPDGGERFLIADLGVAKSLAQGSGLTMSVGSAGYMAPEQAGPNTGVDVRADVYSLGAIGYRLLTGEVPGGPGQVVPPDRLVPGLPAEARSVLTRALAPDRDRRWPDASSLADELDRLASTFDQAARPRRARIGLVTGATLVVLVVAAAAGFVGLRYATAPVEIVSGRISLDVPRSWGAQLADGGWDPRLLGLTEGSAEGIVVADHVRDWPDLDRDVNGVFVGLSDEAGLPAAVGAITHPGCAVGARQTYRTATWTGRYRRFTGCGGTERSITEAELAAPAGSGAPTKQYVYVQVRQVDGADRVRDVIERLRVRS